MKTLGTGIATEIGISTCIRQLPESSDVHLCEGDAVMEGMDSNAGNRVGDFQLCQGNAASKHLLLNADHKDWVIFTCVREVQPQRPGMQCWSPSWISLCQGAAASKGPLLDAGHRVGDFHLCQGDAASKGPLFNAGH